QTCALPIFCYFLSLFLCFSIYFLASSSVSGVYVRGLPQPSFISFSITGLASNLISLLSLNNILCAVFGITDTLSSCVCTLIEPILLSKISLLFLIFSSNVFNNVCTISFAFAVLSSCFLLSSCAKVELIVGYGFFLILQYPLT